MTTPSGEAIGKVMTDLLTEGVTARSLYDTKWDGTVGTTMTPIDTDQVSKWLASSAVGKSAVRFMGVLGVDADDRSEATFARTRANVQLFTYSLMRIHSPTIIDATALYEQLIEHSRAIDWYADHECVMAPSDETAIAYVNQHGNVTVMHIEARLYYEDEAGTCAEDRWETENLLDWSEVDWVLDIIIWVGGRGGNGPVSTCGPMHRVKVAVSRSGRPLDIHWLDLQVPGAPMDQWDMALVVTMQALNFLNCRNVDVVEPKRDRATRRRMGRDSPGVIVKELSVFPVGRRSAPSGNKVGAGVALHSVRGHFQHNGNCCPGAHPERGKLFGKLEGRYWIPMHARGDSEHGQVEKTYRLRP